MSRVAVSLLGDLVVVHPDDPGDALLRRRLRILLEAPLPRRGIVRVLPGFGPDEVAWQTVLSEDPPTWTRGALESSGPLAPDF